MIEDNTPSGVPLPHPGNPAIADATRIRNALTVIDTRQVAAGTAHADLAAALATESTARIAGDAAEATARAGAIAAEATTRANADTALSNAIAAIPTFNPALYYDKTAVDALIAGVFASEVTTTISGTAATVDFTIDAAHRFVHLMWNDVSHNSGSNQYIAVRYSTDGGASYSSDIWTGPPSAQSNAATLTGGALIWLMPDETAMMIPMQPSSSDVTTTSPSNSSMYVFDTSAGRINRVRVLWTAGSFNAGVVRCRRGK